MIRFATMSFAALMLSSCATAPQVPPAARSELAPTGKLRVGINVQNFLLVNKERVGGEYSGVAVDLGDSQDPLPALRDIKQVSATALRDLRATLNLLRGQAEAAPIAPAFDLESLPRLVDQARSGGLRARGCAASGTREHDSQEDCGGERICVCGAELHAARGKG